MATKKQIAQLISQSHYPLFDMQGVGVYLLPVLPSRNSRNIPYYLRVNTRSFKPVVHQEDIEEKSADELALLNETEYQTYRTTIARQRKNKKDVAPGYPIKGRNPDSGIRYTLTLYEGAKPKLLIEREPRVFVSKLANGTLSMNIHRWTPLEEYAHLHQMLIEIVKQNPL